MTHDGLGLFVTPPDRRHRQVALGIVAAQVLLLPALYAVREVPMARMEWFVPNIDLLLALGDLVTFFMLYAQAAVFRSRALLVLAACFLYLSLMFVVHALTFPGAFAADGLLGAGINSTAWLTYGRRAAVPVAVILYVLFRRWDEAAPPAAPPRTGIAISAAIFLAAAATLMATAGHDLLPDFYRAHSTAYNAVSFASELAMATALVVAIVFLFRNRRSILDLWLLVAMSCWLVHSLLAATLYDRYTAGWYGLNLMLLVSNLILLFVLIAEFHQLHARLALSVAARDRERESRLMSMDAVAAAMSHELGQPLTAVTLNAAAGLDWLERGKPDVDRAIAAMTTALESGRRAADIVKSIRGVLSQGRFQPTLFSLNDLVRDTAALLRSELAGGHASLDLALDESLPDIRADRLQLQLVLVNLIANAIESLRATESRPRRIAVSSSRPDGDDVLIEVTDTGVGFDPDGSARIFDAFYTTKKSGIGLGLSLSRMIVESHGGRLWASAGARYGATFHVQLPQSRLAA